MSASSLSVCDASDRTRHRPVDAIARLLDGLAAALLEVPTEVYVTRPAHDISGSIGAQVRHTLDHIAAFVAATPTSPLSYDHRDRGTAVETDPACALRTIFRLKTALLAGGDRLDDPLAVVSQVSADGDVVRAWSSRARELAFVQSHTVHHLAIISLLLVMQGYSAPAALGYAPSTPRS
jgi:hypothetical protein